MCAQRMQRILTAVVLGVIMYFFAMGQAGDHGSFQIAVVMQFFVIVMTLVWAFTNFCPASWAMKKTFPDCGWED